jgi:FkbM family methyltransferase
MAGSYPETTLFGATVSYLSYFEAKYFASEMESYFQHGIEVNRGDTVFDAGANIGMFSLRVHQRCGGDVNIYAFEPIPPIFEVMSLNLTRLKNQKIRTFAFGLSNEHQTLNFTYFPAGPCLSSAAPDWQKTWLQSQVPRMKRAILLSRRKQNYPAMRFLPASMRAPVLNFLLEIGLRVHLTRVAKTAQSFTVEVRPVSDVIKEQNVATIDLLKIDVEGSEVKVLEGIEEHDWPKIRQVAAEIHAYLRDAEKIADVFRTHGFREVVLEQSPAQKELDIGLVFARR